MRLAILAFAIDPNGSSESRVAWIRIRSAIQNGHEVTIFTTPNSSERLRQSLAEVPGTWKIITPPVSKITYFRVLGGEVNLYLNYIIWQRRVSREIIKKGHLGFDVAHHTSWGTVVFGSGLTNSNIPWLYGPVGGVFPSCKELLPFFQRDKNKEIMRRALRKILLRTKLARNSISDASIILATNRATWSYALKRNAKDVRFFLADSIPNKEIERRSSAPTEQVAVFVARLLPRKGANIAIRAFANTLITFPEAKLIIIGSGPMKEQLIRLTKKLQIEDNVEFLGQIEWNQVQNQYGLASVSLFTSLRDSSGAQVLEASAKGVPVITLETNGITDWLPTKELVSELNGVKGTVFNVSEKLSYVFRLSAKEWIQLSNKFVDFACEHVDETKSIQIENFYREMQRSRND